jgi:hypothetical protein
MNSIYCICENDTFHFVYIIQDDNILFQFFKKTITSMIFVLVALIVFLLMYTYTRKGAYGYSIWYVPIRRLDNWRFSHIPHVTIANGYSSIKEAQRMSRCLPQRVRITPLRHLQYFGSPKDPLPGWGLEVHLPYKIQTEYKPHLTVAYTKKPPETTPCFSSFLAKVVIADTRSSQPSEWKILNLKNYSLL